jgi:hypothetical protein
LYLVNGDSAGGNLPDSVIVKINDEVLWTGEYVAETTTLAWEMPELDTLNVLETAVYGATGARTTIWLEAKDTTAPVVSWDVPADGYVTNDTLVAVSGSVENESSTWLVAAAGTGQLGQAEHDSVSLGLGAGGPFSFELRLVEGSNYIFIGAGNALQLFDDDNIRWVTLDTQAPSLSVTQPTEGFLTSADSVEVSGTVSDDTDVEVTANGVPLAVNAGSFSGKVPLVDGTNVITVTATDAATNASYVIRNAPSH